MSYVWYIQDLVDAHSLSMSSNTTMAIDIAESAELLHKKQAQTIERKASKSHTLD